MPSDLSILPEKLHPCPHWLVSRHLQDNDVSNSVHCMIYTYSQQHANTHRRLSKIHWKGGLVPKVLTFVREQRNEINFYCRLDLGFCCFVLFWFWFCQTSAHADAILSFPWFSCPWLVLFSWQTQRTNQQSIRNSGSEWLLIGKLITTTQKIIVISETSRKSCTSKGCLHWYIAAFWR